MKSIILVVDDELDLEALVRQKFRKKIRENEYEFIFAHNGVEALNILKENHAVDVMLTDINMPEMDGLTLLSKLSELDHAPKTIIISAYGDMKNIRAALNRGAFDFLTKPIDLQDLEITLDKVVQLVQQLKENELIRMEKEEAEKKALQISLSFDIEHKQRILAERLRDLTQVLVSTLKSNEVANHLLKNLTQIITCESAVVLLKEGLAFRPAAVSGKFSKDKLDDLCIRLGDNKFFKDLVEASQAFSHDADAFNCNFYKYGIDGVKAWFCIPIEYNNQVAGIVIVQSNTLDSYSENDREIAFTIVGQAGIAIENARLFGEISRRRRETRDLLDNAGQGFLSFGQDFCVKEEYSQECKKIFNCDVGGQDFPKLIFPCDIEEQDTIRLILQKIFLEKDELKKSVYFSLLPDEVSIDGKYICVEYKAIDTGSDIDNKTIMTILTDITDKRILEKKMEEEKNILKMVVKVVKNYNDFAECLRDYKFFFAEKIFEILSSDLSIEDMFTDIFRDVHTLKGTFGQIGFPYVVEKLHDLESELSEIRKQLGELTADDLKMIIGGYKPLQWLDKDIDVLKRILGDKFFEQESVVTLDKAKLIEIEKKMLSLLSPNECKILLPEIKALRRISLNEALKKYSDHVEVLAQRLQKQVNALAVTGEEVFVDEEKYYHFIKALIHVFRNIVDHGIEATEERLSLDKDEVGNISCNIQITQKGILLTIADDGRGMDIEVLRMAAVEKGIYDAETAGQLSENEILEVIFNDIFSTKTDITEVSGRGVGLAAVKNEVDKIEGNLFVETLPGIGTTFRFMLPHEDTPRLSPYSFCLSLSQEIKYLLGENLDSGIWLSSDSNVERVSALHLQKLTSFSTLKGILDGKLILSVDTELANRIIRYRGMAYEGQDRDVLADISDILDRVFERAAGDYPELISYVIAEKSVSLHSDSAILKYMNAEIWEARFKTKLGCLVLGFIHKADV